MMKRVVRARLLSLITVSVAILCLVLFGIFGMAAAALPPASARSVSTMDPKRCGEVDIDATTEGVQSVPDACLLTTAAHEIYKLVTGGARVALLCPYATIIVYAYESLSFLSRNIKARNPFAWARFEVCMHAEAPPPPSLLTLSRPLAVPWRHPCMSLPYLYTYAVPFGPGSLL